MNTLATIIIAILAIAAAVSHLRAARYRRERDEARGKAARVWNQCRAAAATSAAATNAADRGPSAVAAAPALAAPAATESIPEVPLNEAFGFAVTAEDEPVILPFRRFWTPQSSRHRS